MIQQEEGLEPQIRRNDDKKDLIQEILLMESKEKRETGGQK